MRGSSLNTAFQTLYGVRELGLAQRFDSPGTDETWVFIYGGSSGVGQFAIQLAKLSGYKVVSVASPRNHELLRNLGADAVFDVCVSPDDVPILGLMLVPCLQYRDPDMVKKIKDAAGNKISHVLDAISGPDTQIASVKVLAEGKPGKVVTVLPHADGVQAVRKDVQVTSPYTLLPHHLFD